MAGMNPQFSDSQFMPGCPRCPHGPMLALLNTQSPSDRFACSAFRNKADCGKDARLQNGSRLHWSVNELLKAAPGDRGYCIECDCLYRCSITSRHVAHKTQIGLTDDLLRMPSFLLKPVANSSGHAQYFFSLESLNHLYSIFCQVGAQFVLCIGSPRMHEFIQLQRTHRSQPMDSHLLDMDFRLKSFYGEKFSRYNMVNGFLFTPTDDSCFHSFCTRAKELSKCVLFCDPPFASPLCLILKQMDSLRSLLSDRNCDKVMNKKPSAGSGRNLTPIFFVLPYFFEHKLQKMAPFFALLDYKVTYTNHPRFDFDLSIRNERNSGRRRDSVVRLFTDMSPSAVRPPEGLDSMSRFCEVCQRYSFLTNQHCSKCGKCPSKHGPTYVHCDLCGRCRPPNRKHCSQCGRCVPIGQCAHEQMNNSGTQRKRKRHC